MFYQDDMVVYPGYGVAKVDQIIEKSVAGSATKFLKLHFLSQETTVLVPITSASSVGVRHLTAKNMVGIILAGMSRPHRSSTTVSFSTNWNRRNKEYQAKLKGGSLLELADVYRELRGISSRKELSFAEKDLLKKVETLLVEEISLVKKLKEQDTADYLRSICGTLIGTSVVSQLVA